MTEHSGCPIESITPEIIIRKIPDHLISERRLTTMRAIENDVGVCKLRIHYISNMKVLPAQESTRLLLIFR